MAESLWEEGFGNPKLMPPKDKNVDVMRKGRLEGNTLIRSTNQVKYSRPAYGQPESFSLLQLNHNLLDRD